MAQQCNSLRDNSSEDDEREDWHRATSGTMTDAEFVALSDLGTPWEDFTAADLVAAYRRGVAAILTPTGGPR